MARAYPLDWDFHLALQAKMHSKWKAYKVYHFSGGELCYADWCQTEMGRAYNLQGR